ncbi:MAG: hypothetical protein VB064_03140 [Oscillospiraceae bacterium]|nr:hypothetical protein [Oscillospiraceae bacterium]
MKKVIKALDVVGIPVNPLSGKGAGEQIIYNIVPISDNGVVQVVRLELKILGASLERAELLDKQVRQTLLSIGDEKKNDVLDIYVNGGGTLQSEVGVHRLINFTIIKRSDVK